MQTKRLFIAIHIVPSVAMQSYIFQVKSELSRERIKWIDEGQMHLTLKFLGDIQMHMVKPIQNQLRDSISIVPFQIHIGGLKVFEKRGIPAVLALEVHRNKQLFFLHKQVELALARIYITPDKRSFRPHLTLGRIKHLNDKDLFYEVYKKYQQQTIQQVNISQFQLFESHLTPEGAIHNSLEKYHLAL